MSQVGNDNRFNNNNNHTIRINGLAIVLGCVFNEEEVMTHYPTSIPPIQETHRLVPERIMWFPRRINVNHLVITEYMHRGKIRKCKGLTPADFDSIQYVSDSDGVIHAIGYRIKERVHTVLIMKYRSYSWPTAYPNSERGKGNIWYIEV